MTLAVSDIKKQTEAGDRFAPDKLPANAPHAEFVKATDEMNRRLKELDLDAPEIEELEDPAPEEEPETAAAAEEPAKSEESADPEKSEESEASEGSDKEE